MKNFINVLVVIVLFSISSCSNRGKEMNFTVELSELDLFMEISSNKTDSTFMKIMDEVMIEKQQHPDSSIVDLFYYYCQKQDPKISISHFFLTLELHDYIDYQIDDDGCRVISNETIRKGLKQFIVNAWKTTYRVMNYRIDYSGNGEVSIKQDKDEELAKELFYCFPQKQITFKLRRVEHPERVRKLLSAKGNFGVYEINQDVGSHITMNDLKLQHGGKGIFNNNDINNARKIKEGGSVKIKIEFNASSEGLLHRFISYNRGKKIAIVIDDKIFATSVNNESISGGQLIIPVPSLTKDEIEDLVIMLKSGCLQTSVKITNEQIVK